MNHVPKYGPGAMRGKRKDIDAAIETLCDDGRIRVFSYPGSKSRRIAQAFTLVYEGIGEVLDVRDVTAGNTAWNEEIHGEQTWTLGHRLAR